MHSYNSGDSRSPPDDHLSYDQNAENRLQSFIAHQHSIKPKYLMRTQDIKKLVVQLDKQIQEQKDERYELRLRNQDDFINSCSPSDLGHRRKQSFLYRNYLVQDKEKLA